MRILRTSRILTACIPSFAVLLASRVSHAYRPFDGTDAAVANVGEFELELGPAQLYRTQQRNYLLAPATVLNLGVAPGLELVVDFKQIIATRAEQEEPRARWADSDILLKWIIRRGALQEGKGISLALEAGPLLPDFRGEEQIGGQANLILSQRGGWGTLHFNEESALSRAGNAEVFSSVIFEAPDSLPVRPVAEVFVERAFRVGSAYSALLGAIWPAAERVSVDCAVRMAHEERARAFEIRFGFTWAQQIWSPAKPHRMTSVSGMSNGRELGSIPRRR